MAEERLWAAYAYCIDSTCFVYGSAEWMQSVQHNANVLSAALYDIKEVAGTPWDAFFALVGRLGVCVSTGEPMGAGLASALRANPSLQTPVRLLRDFWIVKRSCLLPFKT